MRCRRGPSVRSELNAWIDTYAAGAISDVIDDHSMVIVLVRREGMFAEGNSDGEAFIELTTSEFGGVEFVEP